MFNIRVILLRQVQALSFGQTFVFRKVSMCQEQETINYYLTEEVVLTSDHLCNPAHKQTNQQKLLNGFPPKVDEGWVSAEHSPH